MELHPATLSLRKREFEEKGPEVSGGSEDVKEYEECIGRLERKHEMLRHLTREHDVGMWIIVSERFHPDLVMQCVVPHLRSTRSGVVVVFVNDGSNQAAAYSD